MAEGLDKGQVVVREVEVRLVRGEERRRWDELMERHHYLGFRQFAGRGLRQVAEWRGQSLVGWQSGAFKCGVRDRWLGWHRSVQFRRLHLIGNNTRFLILPEAEGIANLGSRVLGRSLRRVSGDWEAAHGHGLELAETFVDPARFHGGVYDATNWVRVGRTKGFARHNGAYTDAHQEPKEMFVRALRRGARERLADPADRPEWNCRGTKVCYTREELRSLRELFAQMPDCRRGQGRKHRLATVLAICALARLSGLSGPAATERFARHLSQEELRALGAWRDPKAGRWVAPSDSTLCRVVADTDPDALQDVLSQWAAPRAVATGLQPALAADGKRIRGANRHTDEGVYFETVTLVTHAGRPLASRCCRDKGGEIAAARALLEDVDVQGCVITLDALHTTRDTERAIVETHGGIRRRPARIRAAILSRPGRWLEQRADRASPPSPHTALTPNNCSPGTAGPSKTATTTGAMPASARTKAASAPATPPPTTPPSTTRPRHHLSPRLPPPPRGQPPLPHATP